MTGRAKKYLFDIVKSIQSINDYIGEERDFESFKNSKIVRRAVEREFEVIGEAVNRLLRLDESPEINNARRIVDLRNFIIHAYDDVDAEILWGIIVNNLPDLRREVELLLDE